jgi:hypothetical protein
VTTKRAADRSTAKAGAAVRTAMRPIEAPDAGGGTHGLMVGHVAPEAALGGPIAFAADGDEIVIDVDRKALDLNVPEAVLAERRAAWTPPAPRYTGGVMAKYAALVSSASEGAVTRGAVTRGARMPASLPNA